MINTDLGQIHLFASAKFRLAVIWKSVPLYRDYSQSDKLTIYRNCLLPRIFASHSPFKATFEISCPAVALPNCPGSFERCYPKWKNGLFNGEERWVHGVRMDLSRFDSAPVSHLGGLSFESQGAFPC